MWYLPGHVNPTFNPLMMENFENLVTEVKTLFTDFSTCFPAPTLTAAFPTHLSRSASFLEKILKAL